MIPVTYIGPVIHDKTIINSDSITTRAMHNILSHQKNINVTYSDIPLISKLFCESSQMLTKDVMINFFRKLIKDIKTDYVLITCVTYFQLHFVIELLKSNKKVILGGPITKIWKCEELRKIILDLNDTELLKNLIIIKPYIGKDFSLWNTIKRWKDEEHCTYNLEGIFEDDEDFYLEQIKRLKDKNIKITHLQIMFNAGCTWGKCTFCSQSHNNFNVDFSKAMDADKFANSIIKIAKENNIKTVFIFDPILNITEKKLYVIKKLKKNGLTLACYSNVNYLNNSKNFDIITKYMDAIEIGIESFSDFQLKQINKGYKYQDIEKLFKTIIRKKPNCVFVILLIYGLPSYDKNDIITNYNRIAKWKLELEKENIRHIYKRAKLQVHFYTDIIYNPYLKMIQKGDWYYHYERLDSNKKFLPGDKDIVRKEIYDYVNNNVFTIETVDNVINKL